MKTKTIIISTLFILNVSLAFAVKNTHKGLDGPANSDQRYLLEMVAPLTPSEATFEEIPALDHPGSTPVILSPVTPREAIFEDAVSVDASNSSVPRESSHKSEINKKSGTVYPGCPQPCDTKYGCGL